MSTPTEPLKWRKKPVVAEAVRFTGSNHRQVLKFVYPGMSEDGLSGAELMKLPIVIGTLEGDMTAQPGDWIIKGVQGEFYPCKPGIFAATYEPADASARDAAAEAVELLVDAMHQGCHQVDEGWLQTQAISTWCDIGDYLVEHAGWERHPGGKPGSRLQWYRPPQQEGEP